jgi:hypothetical protein
VCLPRVPVRFHMHQPPWCGYAGYGVTLVASQKNSSQVSKLSQVAARRGVVPPLSTLHSMLGHVNGANLCDGAAPAVLNGGGYHTDAITALPWSVGSGLRLSSALWWVVGLASSA